MEKSISEILAEHDEAYKNLSPEEKEALSKFTRLFFARHFKEEDND
jgi:hypothetical protein